jgi:alcohol dehydrogenase class IV
MSFTLVAPRSIVVGGGAVAEIAGVLAKFGLSRPLVVTEPNMVSSGLLERCLDPLTRAGVRHAVFSGAVCEPTDVSVEAGVAFLRAGAYDCLIGFGGGSPIDTAKAMAIVATGGEGAKPRAFKVPFVADAAALPIIAIPTTAGTGSEVTRNSIITDTERTEKMLISGLGAVPLAAIVDFTLSFSVSKRTTADTGLDTLCHALEAYVSRRANPYSDVQARWAFELIGHNLRTAFHEPDNAAAREAMMLSATIAGLSFSNASVALVHGMSRPIGAHFHVPHGLSNAMLLPAVTRFGLSSAVARYAEAARHIGFSDSPDDAVAAEALADGLAAMNAEFAVPSPRQFGIDPQAWESKIDLMADQALASGSPANNPRLADKAEILELYRAVYAG